jgi:hypothetical protein
MAQRHAAANQMARTPSQAIEPERRCATGRGSSGSKQHGRASSSGARTVSFLLKAQMRNDRQDAERDPDTLWFIAQENCRKGIFTQQ